MKKFADQPTRSLWHFPVVLAVCVAFQVVVSCPAADPQTRVIGSEGDLRAAMSDRSAGTLRFNGGSVAVTGTDPIRFAGTWSFNTSGADPDVPMLSAPSISLLSATLEVGGAILERIDPNHSTYALLEASTLSDDFGPATIDSPYDFLELGVRNRSITDGASAAVTTRLEVSQNLRWERGTSTANGTFTLGKGESFDVGVSLSDQTRPIIAGDIISDGDWEHGWDGKSLLKAGEGALTLSALNRYTGTTTVESGTLRLGTTDAIKTSSGVQVAQGATLRLGGFDQTLHELSGAGTVVLDAGKTLTVASATSSTFAGTFRSEGDPNSVAEILKTGRGVWEFTGTSANAISLSVQEGTFVNNGNLAGRIDVLAGATLAGNGMQAAGASFRRGAVHSPGNSIDMNYEIPYVDYDAGAVVFMEVGPGGESDRILALGGGGNPGDINFSRGGNAQDGTLVWLQNYREQLTDKTVAPLEFTLFTAPNGGIKINGQTITSGDYGPVSVNGNDLAITNADGVPLYFESDASLDIDGVEVSTVNGQQVLKIFLTPNGLVTPLSGNRQALVDSLPDAAKIGVYSMSGDERTAAIDQLSPGVQSVMPYVHRRAAYRFNETTFKRLEHLAYHGKSGCVPKGRQLWAEFNGDYTDQGNDGDYYGYTFKSWGGTVGLDVMLLRDFIAGVNIGGMETDTSMKDGFQRGKSRLLLTSLYSMWFGNNWSIKTSVGYNWGENSTYRNLPSFGASSNGKTHGNAIFAGVEFAKHLRYNHTSIVPFYKFDFINLWEDGYTENNPDVGLTINKRTSRGYLQTLGARLEYDFFTQQGCVVTPSVYGGWIHDFGEGRIHTTAAMPGAGTFTYGGIGNVRDRALIGIGLNITPNENWTLFGRYEAELAEHFSSQIGSVGFGFLW